LIRFFGSDTETAVIGIYLEGIDEPRELIRAAREVVLTKPVLSFKVGKSEAIDGPARSHTGSLAGRYEMYRDGLKQAGLLWMESPQELMDAAKLFTWQEPIRGPRVAIMSIQAGAAIMLTDLCASSGLELAHLSSETQRKIGELVPPKTYLQNPVDMGFMWMPPIFIEVAKTLLQDPEVDILIMYALAVPGPMAEMLKFVAGQVLPSRRSGKILMLCTDICTHSLYQDIQEIEQAGVPVYVSPERAIRSLVHKVEYEKVKRRLLRAKPHSAL
jgi:acyl-CoA synthetase (NDP forming)